jgi:hypothetical protein
VCLERKVDEAILDCLAFLASPDLTVSLDHPACPACLAHSERKAFSESTENAVVTD